MNIRLAVALAIAGAAVLMPPRVEAQNKHTNAVIDLWMQGKVAFGVFVPNENAPQRPGPVYTRAGGERLAMNPLYDYVFLNLEGSYDAGAIKAIAEGLRSPKAVSRKTLIVRVPAFHENDAD